MRSSTTGRVFTRMDGAIIHLHRCMRLASKFFLALDVDVFSCSCSALFNYLFSQSQILTTHFRYSNFGYGHSNEGSQAYGDQSGMMGFSYSNDEGPVSKC